MLLKFKKNFFFIIFFISILVFHQVIFQQFFPNTKGLFGHDYSQYIPNLIFGKIWFYNNFLSIPWFTPSFCCGTPFYADPNTAYYSIPQLIFLIFNPVLSIKIIFFIMSSISYFGMYLLLRKNFKFDNYVALLCASLFLFNGFFVYKTIAGPILSYVIIPLYCYILIKSFEIQLQKINYNYLIVSSIIFAYFFHSGSGSIILIILTSIFCILLFYSLIIKNLKIFFNFFLSLILGVLISLSKITAVLFFFENFPRKYPPTEFHSIAIFLKNFFLSFFINPDQNYFNENINSMFPFGLHEMEYSLSIIPLILLFFIFFINKKNIKLHNFNSKIYLCLFVIFLIPIFLNVNIFNQYEIVEKIPVLKNNWVRFRWMAIYIIPIIFLSGILLQTTKFKDSTKKKLASSMILILLIQNLIKDKSWHYDDLKYNSENLVKFHENFNKNNMPQIKGPAILMNVDGTPKHSNSKNDLFFNSYSPLTCYQPIFGYGLEKLDARKIIFNSKHVFEDNSYILYSNKFDKKGDNFNFFNPACFLFPNENNCMPGDTFKIDEKEKLAKFTSYKEFEFKQNLIQKISNYISIFSAIGCLIYLFVSFNIKIFKIRKKK
tara:strand:- start:338 stop:2146 length:1809 start_codon:yes stop_codon:yes gene_type:complete